MPYAHSIRARPVHILHSDRSDFYFQDEFFVFMFDFFIERKHENKKRSWRRKDQEKTQKLLKRGKV